jgi:hypothetical protein
LSVKLGGLCAPYSACPQKLPGKPVILSLFTVHAAQRQPIS